MGDNDVLMLRAELRALREHFDIRFDDSNLERNRMHHENLSEFKEIKADARAMDTRMTRLEEQQRTVGTEFQAVRDRWHKFRDSVQLQMGGGTAESGENRKLTMRDVYLFTGGVGMFYALAKLLKWIP